MARRAPNLPPDNIHDINLTVRDWRPGTVTLLDENRMPAGGVIKSTNAYQIQDGVWTKKWGSAYYSVAAEANIDGAFPAVNPNKSSGILEVANGKLWYSQDGGSKTQITITGGTLAAGHRCFFLQIRGYVYISNNFNALVRYDTTLMTATGYTALATPVAATLALTGLAAGSYNAYYVIVASNDVGTTVGSPEAVISVNKQRDEWATDTTQVNTTNFVTLTITRVTGATRYSIFYADQSGKELYVDSVADPGTGTTFTYVDRGQVPVNDFVELPNDNTTGGPILGPMWLSGNRVWAIGADRKIYWSGVGQYTGIFSAYYGGGWVELEKGGREWPTSGKHYRDGKGTAMSTLFTTNPEGNGSTWQVVLDTITVGSTSFIVPNPVKIVGSIGCSSPWGAAEVGDDIVFGNRKGAYALGSQPSLLNVLATRELSANIRPTWRGLSGPAMAAHACYYYDAKLFWALPASSTLNSQIWIRDFEKRNWQLAWEGVGVASFFEYTDSSGNTHLLGVPVGGTRFIEFSESIRGDFGEPFETRIMTGIIPIDAKNHNQFAQIEYLYAELANPIGVTTINFFGYDYTKGFINLGTLTITGPPLSSHFRWGQRWSKHFWSFSPTLTQPTVQSPYRRYKRINHLINNIQFEVFTTGIGDSFQLLEIGASGYLEKTDPPRPWKTGNVRPSVAVGAITDEAGNPIEGEGGEPILI